MKWQEDGQPLNLRRAKQFTRLFSLVLDLKCLETVTNRGRHKSHTHQRDWQNYDKITQYTETSLKTLMQPFWNVVTFF